MGRPHEVVLRRGRLGFQAHTVKELELLEELGERCGCLEALQAFRGSGPIDGPWRWEAEIAQRKRLGRLSARKVKVPYGPGKMADRRLLEAVLAVREAIDRSGLEAGLRLGWLWLGFVSKANGLKVMADEVSWDGSRATSASVFFKWRWYMEAYRAGRAILDRKLVLGWDSGPLVLWLPHGVARLEGDRIVPLEPRWKGEIPGVELPRVTPFERGSRPWLQVVLPWGKVSRLDPWAPWGSKVFLPAKLELPWAKVELNGLDA